MHGEEHKFHGTVIVTLCDTQAAHQLGGFKIGVGFALRKCRDCMATHSDIQLKVCSLCFGIINFCASFWHS